ncbi:bifunctional lysine-specific demethylase and histidyl-hydroxylase NO66 isoform X2 [Lasioglossum baleicum]|uniref:bifunctional lysine-specific demethylase and histidyl-hydroxylase NO66 isoform X2 n=1 Tax=Lasioglossum baleicum TaxID=434251 RepID=UPI003FCE99CB
MLKYHEPISAFAMQALKRKNIELASKSKKLKKKHSSPERKVILQRDTKQVTQQQLNQVPVNANQKKTNKTSTNKCVSKKIAPSTLKKSKSLQNSLYKSKDKNTKIVNNLKGSKVQLKQLKSSIVMVNKGVAKMKHVNQKHSKQKIRKVPKKVNQIPVHREIKMTEDYQENPLHVSRSMFEWLIHPLKVEDFFEKHWEQTAVHIKRDSNNYYKLLMSTPMLDKILRESYIQFTKNIDITSYENGVRETHNPIGRAVPSVVWDYYANGCSVRMLNPQTYIPKLHSLNATLQEYFGCFVGANSYLTPANSQGFAPHYDDIEAFILQVEGKKRWRLYKPRSEGEYLPKYCSKNFEDSEIGEPILDTVVNAGDLLYFPRGTIHQGNTLEDSHSLHITLSVYQKNSWSDFLEKLLPDALRTATENDSEFRKGLPLDYLRHCGLAHSENQSSSKEEFRKQVKHLLKKMVDHIDVDKAADLMARNHVHDFMPPVLSEVEQECSVLQDGERMTANGCVKNRVEIEPDTKIRLVRSHSIRLVEEDGVYRLYYSSENSKEYHEYEPQFLELGEEYVLAVKEIILRYPEFIAVEDLPVAGEDNQEEA